MTKYQFGSVVGLSTFLLIFFTHTHYYMKRGKKELSLKYLQRQEWAMNEILIFYK